MIAIVLIIVAVLVAGGTGITRYKKTVLRTSVSLQSTTSTQNNLPAKGPQIAKNPFIYIKHDRAVEDSVILFDPKSNNFLTLKNDTPPSDNFLTNPQSQAYQPIGTSSLTLSFERDLSATLSELFFMSYPDGKKTIVNITHADSNTFPKFLFISPNDSKILYCSPDGAETLLMLRLTMPL